MKMRNVSVFVMNPIRRYCSADLEQALATLCVFAALASPVSVRADPSADQIAELSAIEVTATRIPENVEQVPAHMTIIQGDELRARGVTDLRTALSVVAGVEAPPGGDTGPAGAVPSFWGLHEFDAFLLVVDGVPWGGAFNPSIPTLNLNDVQRIEILRGAAPVMYGATSFVGVIQVIHYPAGQAANQAQIGYGSFGSVHGSTSIALPSFGEFQHSIAVDAQKLGFSDPKENITDSHLLYRASAPLAGGTFRFDANITIQHQFPPSPVVRLGSTLTTLTPLDANYNPVNAGMDQNLYQGVLGYSRSTPLGQWDTTVSVAYSTITDIRSFLNASSLILPAIPFADSQNQKRPILDTYMDSHVSTDLTKGLSVIYGADLLYGAGRQTSTNGTDAIWLNPAANLGPLSTDEINGLSDKRAFWGQYAQFDWKPDQYWAFQAGIRLNETNERKFSSHIDLQDSAGNAAANAHKQVILPSGMIGLTYRAWQSGGDEANIFVDYRNTFKPAAIDFGPDYTPNILNPETGQSYEAGIKGALFDRHLSYAASLFLMNFQNLVLQTTNAEGNPVLQNGGSQRLTGGDMEVGYRLSDDLTLKGAFSYHDARFTNGIAIEGGSNVDLTGKQLTLSPHVLAALGLVYSSREGFYGSASVNYIGWRFLDLANTAPTAAYTTVDASIGYRFGRYSISLNGYNLTNQRPPVTQSEFGDLSYYLLPARTIFLNLTASLD
jgi:iron complex outermembrane recepter protein